MCASTAPVSAAKRDRAGAAGTASSAARAPQQPHPAELPPLGPNPQSYPNPNPHPCPHVYPCDAPVTAGVPWPPRAHRDPTGWQAPWGAPLVWRGQQPWLRWLPWLLLVGGSGRSVGAAAEAGREEVVREAQGAGAPPALRYAPQGSKSRVPSPVLPQYRPWSPLPWEGGSWLLLFLERGGSLGGVCVCFCTRG